MTKYLLVSFKTCPWVQRVASRAQAKRQWSVESGQVMSKRWGDPVWDACCQARRVRLSFLLFGRASAQSADAMVSDTDWERGRVKAVSREAGARKREPRRGAFPVHPPAAGSTLPTNDPSGAMPRARIIAPQPCIRWV
jgi:hypothetical protein